MNLAFWRKSIETKNLPEAFGLPPGLYSALVALGWSNFAARQALRYYAEISPLSTAVDMVAETAGLIPPLMWDGGKYTGDDPLVYALRNPNDHQPGALFVQELATYYRVTGNAYILAIGNTRFEPTSLNVIPSSWVGWHKDRGYTVSFPGETGDLEEQFPLRKGRNLSGNGRELFHISAINPLKTSIIAPSPLSSLYYELEQYKEASTHNWAMLSNGAHPGLVIEMAGEALTDDQQQALRSEVNKFYAGSRNSGKTMILGGTKNVVPVSMSNKDMDFKDLRRDMITEIYNRLRVPLPLVSADKMSLANLDSSRVLLYDNAVLPLIGMLYASIQMKLGPRYKSGKNLRLTYDPASITALQTRRLAEAKSISSIGVLSVNELRGRLGYESIGPEGDVISGPSKQVPVGVDQNTGTNRAVQAEAQ